MSNNLSLKQFQDIYDINKSSMDELDKMTWVVAIVASKPHSEIEEMEVSDFKTLTAKVDTVLQSSGLEQPPKRFIVVEGKKYAFVYNPRSLKAWQVIKLQELLKGDIVENLHKLMALIVRPVVKKMKLFNIIQKSKPSDFESIAQIMRHADYNDINSACIYFKKLWNVSIKALKPLIATELLKQVTLPMEKEEAEILATNAILAAQIK